MKIEIIVTIIALLFILTIIYIYLSIRAKRRKKFLSSLSPLKNRLAPVIDNERRLGELEKAMDKLVKEHPVLNKIEDSYPMINNYISCKNTDEYEYCYRYLRKRYLASYRRYDKER